MTASFRNKKVIMAMSGGMDSAAAAWLLKEKHADVLGVYLRLSAGCEEAELKARQACRFLGIKFYPKDISSRFNQEIIKYFIKGYKEGITPNPCVRCNKVIKFSALIRLAGELKADFVATGHYARISGLGLKKLLRAKDRLKDQSYFLYKLSQEELRKILFPLGEIKKTKVRVLARKEKLPFLEKESQDICFLPAQDKAAGHNDFLKKNIGLKNGPIKDRGNKTVGRHEGLPLYTIGQRKGIEIGGTGPYYVVKKEAGTNTLFVTNDPLDGLLYKKEFLVNEINWISGKAPKLPKECRVMIRYGHEAIPAVLNGDSRNPGCFSVALKEAARAITKGQSAVFYDKEAVLGGGIIFY